MQAQYSRSTVGKALQDEVIAALPYHYNLTSLMQLAVENKEETVSGRSCDVTFAELPWVDDNTYV